MAARGCQPRLGRRHQVLAELNRQQPRGGVRADANPEHRLAHALEQAEHRSGGACQRHRHEAFVRGERARRLVDGERQLRVRQPSLRLEPLEDPPDQAHRVDALLRHLRLAAEQAVGLGEPPRAVGLGAHQADRHPLPQRAIAIEEEVQAGLDRRQTVDDLARGQGRHARRGRRARFPRAVTPGPQVVGLRQRARPFIVGVPEQARHFGESGRGRRGEALPTGDEFVPSLAAPDEQGLHDAHRSDRRGQRAQVVVSGRTGAGDVLDRDQVDGRRRGPRRQEIDVVRSGPHAERRRQPLATGGRRRIGLRLVALDLDQRRRRRSLRRGTARAEPCAGRRDRSRTRDNLGGHATYDRDISYSTAMSRSHRGTTTSAATPPGRPVVP